MAGARDRKAMREQLKNRTQEGYDRREETGKFRPYIREDGLEIYRIKEGTHVFDIIPYTAGNHDPHLKPGEFAYVCDVWVHQNVGVTEDQYVCPAYNYKKPCPICEFQNELRKEKGGSADEVKALYPKRRCLYNVVVYDEKGKEEAKGVQVMEVSYHWSEKEFLAQAKNPKTGGITYFADPDEGKTVAFTRKGSGMDNSSVEGYKLMDRDAPVTDAILDQAHVLDELLILAPYDEIKTAFFGAEDDEEEGGGETRTRQGGPASTASSSEEKPSEEPAAEEKPAEEMSAAERVRRKREQQAAQTTEGSDVVNPCPAGHQFGVDIDTKPQCDGCPKWDDCAAEAERIEKEEKEKDSKPSSSRVRK